MTELMPISGGQDRREDRLAKRAIAGYQRSGAVALAQIEQQAQIEAAKAHAIGFVGQQAMQAVTMVSQLEGQLGQACPLAVTRLQGIADITALSMAQVVADATRTIG
jgi:hypothetical protein